MNQSTVRNIMVRTKAQGPAAFLLHVMADHDGGKPHYCWASASSLAAQTNMTRRMVIKHRRRLEALREIEEVGKKRVRTPGGMQSVTCFRVCVERILSYPSRLEGGAHQTPPKKGGCLSGTAQGGVCQASPSSKVVSDRHPKDSVHTEAVVPTASVEHHSGGKENLEDPAHAEWLKSHRGPV